MAVSTYLKHLLHFTKKWWRRAALLMLASLLVALWFLCGDFVVLWPVTPPSNPQTVPIDEAELSTHVRFLAQPALKGRLPFSMGSRIARKYIATQFAACKLKPWGDAPEFNQPFNLGANIVAVLPGSDPALANEYVLVTAHYDHLGYGRLGACDDASGVAAMLEIVEAMATQDPRPKRSVAFAAFDCEELGLLGAYTFSLRGDVQRARIRAVINMDMLGRHFLDLLDNSLIVAGTEFYPETRQAVLGEGDAQGLRVYPAGLDLAGARGDHVAFLNLPRAGDAKALEPPEVLFFSSGAFEDYHEKGDTAERLDYALLTRSTRLIERTARRLADAAALDPRTPRDAPDPGELQLFRAVGTEVLRQSKKLDLTEEHRAAAQSWLREAETCASNPSYSSEDRQDLVRKLDTLGPGVNRLLAKALGGGGDHLKDGDIQKIAGTGEMWRRYGAVFDEGYRGFVEKLLQRNVISLALRGIPDLYEFELPCLTDTDIAVEDVGNGQLRLSMIYPSPKVLVKLHSFGRAGFVLIVDGVVSEVKGTREDLIDYYLMFWMQQRPTEADSLWWLDHVSPEASKTEREAYKRDLEREHEPRWADAVDKGCRVLLEKASGESAETTLDANLDRRLQQKGLPNREAWLASLLDHQNHRLVFCAARCLVRRYPDRHAEEIRTAYLRFLNDTEAPADFRAKAFHGLATDDSSESLRYVVPYLDDTKVFVSPPSPIEEESNPIHQHPIVRYGKDYDSTFEESEKSKSKPTVTLGEVALYELRKATGQDFGSDPSVWLQWLEGGSAIPKDSCGCHFEHPALRTRNYYSWHGV